jgi:hypothetical protein
LRRAFTRLAWHRSIISFVNLLAVLIHSTGPNAMPYFLPNSSELTAAMNCRLLSDL